MVPAIIGAGLLQTGVGLVSRAAGKRELARAEQEYKKNPYQEDLAIRDLYNKMKVSGLESVEGRLGQQQIDRNLLTGLRATAGQRGRDVSSIIRGATGATAGLVGRLAAQRQSGLFGATQMLAQEGAKKYKYNVLDPIGRRYGLSAQQMAEGGSMASSGLRNIVSGLGALRSTKTDDTDKSTP